MTHSATIECAAKLLGADACVNTNCSVCGRWTHAHVWRDWESGAYELTDEVCDRCRKDKDHPSGGGSA